MEENYSSVDLTVHQLAELMECSRSTLHRMIRENFNMTTTAYINEFRIRKSKVVLKKNEHSIKVIALSVGYNDPKYFSRLFQKHYGVSPSLYYMT